MKKDSVFYLSAIDWDFLTQRPQQLLREWSLSSRERDFYYVEPFRAGISLKHHEIPIVLRTPFYFCFEKYGLAKLDCVNGFFVERLVKKAQPFRRVAITCTCVWEPYINKSTFSVICYDYLDALEVHAGAKDFDQMKLRHERLLEKSDIVFVTAEKLRQEVHQAHPDKKVVMVPNGVDYDFFQKNRCSEKLTERARLPRKVVGYVGAIADWIDLELVHSVARLTPELDYVMIGPLSGNNTIIAEKKPENVTYLGSRPYAQVPGYIDMFDVALIPFVKSNISESTDPIKLYEYFALGKPVVATPMLQLNKFNDGCRLVIADGAFRFAEAIRSLVKTDNDQNRRMRQEVARQNSWASKAALMLETIDQFRMA